MNRLIILLFLFISTVGYSSSLPTPTLSFPSNNSNHVSPSLGLGCSSVSGATGYEFRYANNISFNNAISTVGSINQVWIFDLFFSTQYFWQARAFNTTDTSNWSTVFNFRTVTDVNLFSPLDGSSNENVDVQLEWDQIDGVNGYEIELDTVNSFNSPALISIFEGGNTSTNTIDLLFSTVYYWHVRAINNVDTSNWSPDFVFLTVGQPSLLFPLNSTQLIEPNPSLSWFGLSGINGYELQLDTTFDYSSPALQSYILGLNPTQQLNDLYFGKFYNWRVRAFHNADTSDWSGSYNFFVFDKPSTVTPIPNDTIYNSEVYFSWTGTNGVNGYELQIDTISDFSSPFLETIFESNTNTQIQNLNFGSTYYWRVRAYHSVDSSAWSFVRNFEIIGKLELLTPFDSVFDQPTSVYFSWNNIQNIDYYEFFIDSTSEFNSPFFMSFQTSDTVTVLQNLNYDEVYFWKVRAITGSDTTAFSSIRTFKTYKAPQLISPLNNTINVSINPILTWIENSGDINSEIQIDTDILFTNPTTVIISGGTTNFSSLQFNSDYFWRVRCLNFSDTSAWSSIYKFTTEFEINVSPVLISPIDNSTNILCPDTSLVWNSITGPTITGYEIEIDSSNDFSSANFYSTSDTILAINNLVQYTNYFWRVRGVNANGPGIWSPTWTFETSGTTGLISLQANELFIVVSNPFNNDLQITSLSNTKKKFEIYNELGKLIYSGDFVTSININTTNFTSGVYFAKCINQENKIVTVKKLLKQ